VAGRAKQRRGGVGSRTGLGLALLIDAEHHGVLGRVEVEPDDVSSLSLANAS